MGTFHSFISEPLKKEEAETLLKDVQDIIGKSDYRNHVDYFSIVQIGSMYVVVGIYKNLGSVPVELMSIDLKYNWSTVSNENDFYSSDPNHTIPSPLH